MKSIHFVLLFLTLQSCGVGNKYLYLYSLKESKTNTFEDDEINIDFVFTDKMINFTLKNKSDLPLKIEWNESSIVINSITEKVTHSGIKFIDATRSLSPTMVPPQATIVESIMPVSNIYYQEGVRDLNSGATLIRSGWMQKDLLPTIDYKNEELRNRILSNKGKTVGVFLSIYKNNQMKNHYFEFFIKDVIKAK